MTNFETGLTTVFIHQFFKEGKLCLSRIIPLSAILYVSGHFIFGGTIDKIPFSSLDMKWDAKGLLAITAFSLPVVIVNLKVSKFVYALQRFEGRPYTLLIIDFFASFFISLLGFVIGFVLITVIARFFSVTDLSISVYLAIIGFVAIISLLTYFWFRAGLLVTGTTLRALLVMYPLHSSFKFFTAANKVPLTFCACLYALVYIIVWQLFYVIPTIT